MKSAANHIEQGHRQGQLPVDWIDALRYKPLFIGLDRDGTLVPIHCDPDQAVVLPAVRALLGQCACLPDVRLCVVSARSTRQLVVDFGTDQLILAGNYGLEILFPGGATIVQPEAEQSKPALEKVKQEIESQLSTLKTVVFEDHDFSLCLHWHMVPKDSQELVHRVVAQARSTFTELYFRALATSYEILPTVHWDKSRALELIAGTVGCVENGALSIYAGDSQADEPAFRWVNARQGLSIKIGSEAQSSAVVELSSEIAMIDFIKELIALRI